MATITSVGSGLWSAAGTWDAGVPVDDDTVVIASGHTVEFNVDQSGFANGIAGMTITGTLKLTRTAGTYYLKIKAGTNITGAGILDAGTEHDQIPFAAKHTVYTNRTESVRAAYINIWGTEPAHPTIKLSDGEALGTTVLRVDTDVTGDLWADGDTIFICNINNAVNVEERVIAASGIAAGAITITVGLTSAKLAGAFIHLGARNVTFFNEDHVRHFRAFTDLVMGSGSILGDQNIKFQTGTSIKISGGIVQSGKASSFAISQVDSAEISGGVLMSYAGAASTLSTIPGLWMSGGYIHAGTMGAIDLCGGFVMTGGRIAGSAVGIRRSSGFIRNGELFGNATNIENSSVILFNTLLQATNENVGYGGFPVMFYSESFDHNQVQGAFKAWTKGGVTTKQAVVYPTGYTNAMQTVLEDADSEGYWQREQSVGPGQSVNLDLWLRKTAAMAYLPRVHLFRKRDKDPLAGGTALKNFTMTDSIDTWEQDTYTYSNDGAEDEVLVVRCQGKNASGSMFSAVNIEVLNMDLTEALARLGAIKAKTDQLAFTVANQVDANALTGGGGATPQQVWEYVTRTLSTPNDYKADVSALALEASLATVDAVADAIKAKTDQLAFTVANQVDANALTGGGGATPQQVWEYVTRTLSTPNDYKADVTALALEATLASMMGAGWTDETLVALKALLDTIVVHTGTDLPAYLVGLQNWLATEIIVAATVGVITQIRGNTWLIEIEELTLDPHLIQFAIKCKTLNAALNKCKSARKGSDTDADALVYMDSDSGLVYVNGAAAADPAMGNLTYVGTTLTITLAAAITRLLDPGFYAYGIQSINAHGIVSEVYGGQFTILPDVVRTVA